MIRRGTLTDGELGSQLGEARISFDALPMKEGETYVLTLRAPAATPLSKPILAESWGHLLLRGDYD